MSYVQGLRCRECKRNYEEAPIYVCEFCFGPLEVVYDYEAMKGRVTRASITAGPLTMWRYRDLLPVRREAVIEIHNGFTPLLRADRLARELGIDELYIKNDCVNPSYSFKDRVVSVAVTKAIEFGYDTVACASTGNLACSVAAHAARAGLRAFVFVPADLEQGKIIGAAIYEPTLVAVRGSYDEVNRLCSEVADRYNWAFVNINVRPYYSEGSKTLGYEVAEQLGWRAPDHVVVPVASGSLLTKIYKGLHEFQDLGLIPNVHTRVSAAQALGCSPVVSAYERKLAGGNSLIKPVKPATIAKSLAIGNPADGPYALEVIAASGGCATAVSDEEVVDGIKLLARTEGVFAETAGGVTVAALKRLVAEGKIYRDEVTVVYITGNGLKTQEAVMNHLVPSLQVAPTLASFQQALGVAVG